MPRLRDVAVVRQHDVTAELLLIVDVVAALGLRRERHRHRLIVAVADHAREHRPRTGATGHEIHDRTIAATGAATDTIAEVGAVEQAPDGRHEGAQRGSRPGLHEIQIIGHVFMKRLWEIR